MRIDVDDGWAEVRDPRKIPDRLTETIEDAQFRLMETPAADHLADEASAAAFQDRPPAEQMRLVGRDGMHAMNELKRATILAHVTEWSFGDVSRDVLTELPRSTVDALAEKIGAITTATGGPHLNTDVDPDPTSPSSPSSG